MNLDYLVREPENITPSTPIIFMLHGYGSNEHDLFSFRETLPADWIIISFRAPYNSLFEGYSWYDINFNDPEQYINISQATKSLNAILESILKIINHYGLMERKAHLCGFSQGGVLCYALTLKNPELFHRIACLSCYPEKKILDGIIKDKKKLEKLYFFISHGTDDTVIPIEWGRKATDLLYDLSCYFIFREYMSGHGVNPKNYMDLMDFFSKEVILL